VTSGWCECGHPVDWHSHLRPGTDCGSCGAAVCAEFRAAGHQPVLRPGLGRALAVTAGIPLLVFGLIAAALPGAAWAGYVALTVFVLAVAVAVASRTR
jgi:hypothetical protein